MVLSPSLRAKLALFAATQKAMSDLDLCSSKQPLILTISGLSSFGDRVVFADIVEKERLEKMAGIRNHSPTLSLSGQKKVSY